MGRKRKYAKPFDTAHSILYNAYPRTYTETIGVPGKFVKRIHHNSLV